MANSIIHIQGTNNTIIKHLVKIRSDASYRHEQKKAVLSGKSLILEAAQRSPLELLLVCNEDAIGDIPAKKVIVTSEALLKKVTGVESPDGYAAEVVIPAESSLKGFKAILACDAVSDPGNLGTLMRSALAFGWEGVFLLPGTCDPFNDKTLRSARGAQFRLPYRKGTWKELEQLCNINQLVPLAADLDGTDIHSIKKPINPLLILGNEGQGIDSLASTWCQKVTIPISSTMESLNVSIAGSILMFMLRSGA